MEKKASHPWLDDVCIAAIQRKNQAEGTPTYESAAESCTRIIAESHRKYFFLAGQDQNFTKKK